MKKKKVCEETFESNGQVWFYYEIIGRFALSQPWTEPNLMRPGMCVTLEKAYQNHIFPSEFLFTLYLNLI